MFFRQILSLVLICPPSLLSPGRSIIPSTRSLSLIITKSS